MYKFWSSCGIYSRPKQVNMQNMIITFLALCAVQMCTAEFNLGLPILTHLKLVNDNLNQVTKSMGIFHDALDKMETDLSTIKNNLGINLDDFNTMLVGHPYLTNLEYSDCFTNGQLSSQEVENKVPSLDKCINRAKLYAFSSEHIDSSQKIVHNLSDSALDCMSFLARAEMDDCFDEMISNTNKSIAIATTYTGVNINGLLDDFQACTSSANKKLSGELDIAKTVFSICVEV